MQSSIVWKLRPTIPTQASAPPFGVASDAVVAAVCPPRLMLFPAPDPRPLAPVVVAVGCQPRPTPTVAGSAIALKLKALTHSRPNHRDPYRPCDASCEKYPPDASQNFRPQPQPIETQDLKTS